MKHLESQEQERVVQWLKFQYANALFTVSVQEHSANVGKRMRRLRMGYRAGTHDIAIYECRDNKHGLFVEMKAIKGGRLSDEQKTFLAELEKRGYATLVCHGFEEARKGISAYMCKAITEIAP